MRHKHTQACYSHSATTARWRREHLMQSPWVLILYSRRGGHRVCPSPHPRIISLSWRIVSPRGYMMRPMMGQERVNVLQGGPRMLVLGVDGCSVSLWFVWGKAREEVISFHDAHAFTMLFGFRRAALILKISSTFTVMGRYWCSGTISFAMIRLKWIELYETLAG